MYLLRWRFDYVDRPSRWGQWARAATLETDMAYYQNREGLVRACIEAKDQVTREVKTIVECDGHDYVNFSWMAEYRGGTGETHHLGLMMTTREKHVKAFAIGKVVVEDRTDEDKKYNYATFGR